MLTTAERAGMAFRLTTRRLSCGCEAGAVTLLDGSELTVIDEPADECRNRSHQADFVVAARQFTGSHGAAA